MVLGNYVILQEGVPTKMHFTDHWIETRTITDPLTGRTKQVRALVFQVAELNGAPVVAYYSTISERHALQFAPYLEGKKYRVMNFTVTMLGSGFAREWQVKVEPRGGPPPPH
ncbi:MAG: hypothetical protein DDT23_00935 [candidate division WS2 bacterium]|nr:hypothetical protein [Candidatus Lithacetigena glycinireducens]